MAKVKKTTISVDVTSGEVNCIWCDATFTNKIALANHYDNVHKGNL